MLGMLSLGTPVRLTQSRECGIINGRAEYLDQGQLYRVAYVDAMGCHQESWFTNSQLDVNVVAGEKVIE